MRLPVIWVLGIWSFDTFILSLFPLLRSVMDLLLLFLIFLGFKLPSTRWLWVYGLGIGLLKDLTTGGWFGAWSCTFALIGWILGAIRHLLEREDPLMLGVWAGAGSASEAASGVTSSKSSCRARSAFQSSTAFLASAIAAALIGTGGGGGGGNSAFGGT